MEKREVTIDLAELLKLSKKLSTRALGRKYGVSATSVRKYINLAKTGETSAKTFGYVEEEPKQAITLEIGKPKLPVAEELAKAYSTVDNRFDDLYGKYRDYLGWKQDVVVPDSRPNTDLELTTVAGDIHAPYHNEEALKWLLRRTAVKSKRLILAGDIADFFNMSRYAKFKKHYSAMDEIVSVQMTLNLLSESYEEVVLMRGNHDDRFIKYLQRMGLPAEIMDVFDYMHGEYSLHPVYVLARELKNVKVVDPIHKDFAEFSYLYQQGDAVISHAEKFSRTPNKSVGDVIQSLKTYHEPVGVVKPFKVVIQAHTHMAGKTWNDFGVVGIENGCLCKTPDYNGQAGRLPGRAAVLGYTELWQTPEGTTDIGKTNFIPFPG